MQKQHIGAYGVVVRQGRILLTKKEHGPYHGRFDLPGGKIEHGENPETCLHREMMEETGLIVSNLSFDSFHSSVVDVVAEEGRINFHHLAILYRINGIVDEHDIDFLNPRDERIAWRSLERLHEYHLSPHAWVAVTKLKKQALSMPVIGGTMTLIP